MTSARTGWTMDDYCTGCVYQGRAGSRLICEYLLRTGHMRPCPPGEGCTAKKMEGDVNEMPRRSTFDKDRALALHADGKTDLEIADMIGANLSTVRSWRVRAGLSPNRPIAGGTRPEVTVEIPEGLKPAARREPLEGFEPVPVETPVPPEPAAEPSPAPEPVPEPKPPKTPEPDPVPAKQDAEDPVTVEIFFRGCSIRVDAARPAQIAAAGKLLAGVSAVLEAVSISDTNK